MKFIFLSVVIVMIFGLFAYDCAPVGEEEPSSSRIAFRSNRDGNQNSEIYLMDADGLNQQRLTNNPAIDSGSSWSP